MPSEQLVFPAEPEKSTGPEQPDTRGCQRKKPVTDSRHRLVVHPPSWPEGLCGAVFIASRLPCDAPQDLVQDRVQAIVPSRHVANSQLQIT
jgi:hypothetical protein